jgi:hypothetical protein
MDDTFNNGCEAPVYLAFVRLRHAIPHSDLPGEPFVLRACSHVFFRIDAVLCASHPSSRTSDIPPNVGPQSSDAFISGATNEVRPLSYPEILSKGLLCLRTESPNS